MTVGAMESPPDFRPTLPPRPSNSERKRTLSTSDASGVPLLPLNKDTCSSYKHDRSQLVGSASLEDGEDKPLRVDQPSQRSDVYRPKEKVEIQSEGHLPPRRFCKTHTFLKWDFGYWREPARHTIIFGVLFSLVFIPTYYAAQFAIQLQHPPVIAPFQYDCSTSQGWTFVGINLPFGSFSFGQAKAIDLAWNWIVGRGYQGLLSIAAYRVFTDALLRVTESTALPMELYATLAFPTAKLETLYQLGKNTFRYGTLRVKLIFIWLFLATIYLISVPALLDATTAYEAGVDTSYKFSNDKIERIAELMKFSRDESIVRTWPICLSYTSPEKNKGINHNSKDNKKSENPATVVYTYEKDLHFTDFSWRNATYWSDGVQEKCFNDPQNVGNSWRNNATRFYLYEWQDAELNQTWWKKLEDDPMMALDPTRWNEWTFGPTNRTHFVCAANFAQYQWGFSKEWVFLVVMLNNLFIIGTWILWIDCDTNSQLCRARRRLGIWAAMADLSEVVREQLGDNLSAYSNNDILQAIKKRPPVKYTATPSIDSERINIGLRTAVSNGSRLRIVWGKQYGGLKES